MIAPFTRKHKFSTALLVLIYSVGTLSVFTTYYTGYHRLSFQAGVRNSEGEALEKLFFTSKEYQAIQWTEFETEFEWQGKMYDVSRIYAKGEGYVVVCENDEFEAMLLGMFKSDRETGGRATGKGSPQPQFFCSLHPVQFAPESIEVKAISSANQCLYHSVELEISSPPPRFFS